MIGTSGVDGVGIFLLGCVFSHDISDSFLNVSKDKLRLLIMRRSFLAQTTEAKNLEARREPCHFT